MVLLSHLWLVVPRICLPYMHNTLRNLETAGAKGRAGGPRSHSARVSPGVPPLPPPYPEERRVLLRPVALPGRVLPGDTEEGLVCVLPAQPRVAPTLDLRHQPVAEAQGTPGPRHRSPAVGDLPCLPPPGVAGRPECRAPAARSGARGGWDPGATGNLEAAWMVRGSGESESSGCASFAFFSVPLTWEALSLRSLWYPGPEGVAPHRGAS